MSHTLNYAAQQNSDFNPSPAPGAPEGWKSTIQPSKIGTIHVNHTHGPPPPSLPGSTPGRQSSTLTSNRDWRNYLGSLSGSGGNPQTPPSQQPAYSGSPQQHMQQQQQQQSPALPGPFGVGPPPPPPQLGTPQGAQGTPNSFTAPYGAPGSAYATPTHDSGSNYGTPSHPSGAAGSYGTPTHQGSYGMPSDLGRQDTVSGHSHMGHAQHGSGGGSASAPANASDPFSVLHAQYSAAAGQPNWYTPPPSVPPSLYQQQQQQPWR